MKLIRLLILTFIFSANSTFAADYIVCESSKDRRTYCDVYRAYDADIYLSRRLSEAPCSEGYSWGRDDRGVWVDRGCRAEFAIRRSRDKGYHGGIHAPIDPYNRYDYERQKREEIEREIEKTRELREELERERAEKEKTNSWQPSVQEHCPTGFEPGNHRCTNEERRRGCKDMRMPGGTTCNSRGWGSR